MSYHHAEGHASESLPVSYNFTKDFDEITRPGLIRFLDTLAALHGEAFDGDRAAEAAKGYRDTLWRAMSAEQIDSEIRESDDWDAERAAAIAAQFEADAIHDEMGGDEAESPPCNPVRPDDPVMAAAAELTQAQVSDDAWTAHSESALRAAGQRLQDMRDRGLEDNADLVSKWILKQLRADRRRAESEARQQERAKTKQKPEGDRTERDPKARTKKPLPSPESGAEQLDLNEPLYAREWLYAGHYVRKYVTATIAQSKVGKSLVIMMECLAMATGRRDIPHRAPIRNLALGEKLRVMYVNGEDPIEEVKLRFRALAQHFGVSQRDLQGWLFIGSGRRTDFVVALDKKGNFAYVAPVVDAIVETIRTLKIDALIIDPLVAFHNVPENDNSKMDSVIQLFRDIADECNIAVEIVAHTRKTDEAVTTQDFRGGGGQIGGVRAVRTVNLMTETEGKDAGLEPGEHKWLIGLDNDSANMSEPGGTGHDGCARCLSRSLSST